MNDACPPSAPDAGRQLASLPIAVLLIEPGLRINSANPAAEQFFGRGERRLAGRGLPELMTFDDTRMMARIADGETPVSARQIGIVLAGYGHRRVDLTLSPVVDQPRWQLLTLHDNSASEALGDDAGGVDGIVLRGPEVLAHEIKNPLAGIRGAAQLLGRKLDIKERALTDLITAEVDRIATLIDRMQKLSRSTTPPLEACNLHEAVRRAIAVVSAAGEGGGPRIVEEFDPSLPPVLGSPDELVQVVINLLTNAREACGDNPGGELTVRTRFASGLQHHSPRSGEQVRLPIELRITDNGPGVVPAMREHIFEPFVTSKKSGQGLGLALVRKLVHDMNGRIVHEREEARALTHFRVHLPLAARPAARQPTRSEAA